MVKLDERHSKYLQNLGTQEGIQIVDITLSNGEQIKNLEVIGGSELMIDKLQSPIQSILFKGYDTKSNQN